MARSDTRAGLSALWAHSNGARQGGIMSDVIIVKHGKAWVLIIGTGLGTDQHCETWKYFKTLQQAIDYACIINVHVENLEDLPLTQYRLVS